MAAKLSIYAGEPLATVLAGYDDQRSGRVNQVCADYLLLIPELAPEMSRDEWCAVCDALNGLFIPDGDHGTYRFIWAEVADCEGLGEKWAIDQAALAARLRAMSVGQLIAAAEVSRRFWVDPSRPPDQALAEAGARITG